MGEGVRGCTTLTCHPSHLPSHTCILLFCFFLPSASPSFTSSLFSIFLFLLIFFTPVASCHISSSSSSSSSASPSSSSSFILLSPFHIHPHNSTLASHSPTYFLYFPFSFSLPHLFEFPSLLTFPSHCLLFFSFPFQILPLLSPSPSLPLPLSFP